MKRKCFSESMEKKWNTSILHTMSNKVEKFNNLFFHVDRYASLKSSIFLICWHNSMNACGLMQIMSQERSVCHKYSISYCVRHSCCGLNLVIEFIVSLNIHNKFNPKVMMEMIITDASCVFFFICFCIYEIIFMFTRATLL